VSFYIGWPEFGLDASVRLTGKRNHTLNVLLTSWP